MFKELFVSRPTATIAARGAFAQDDARAERVVLPDGNVLYVARGSIAAAKAVVAAKKAALRRLDEQNLIHGEMRFGNGRARAGQRAS